MAKREYDLFPRTAIEGGKIPEPGGKVSIVIRDCETLESIAVIAILSRNSDEFPDGDILWIRNLTGGRQPDPWGIKRLEERDMEDE